MKTKATTTDQTLSNSPRRERVELSRRNLTLLLLGVLCFPPLTIGAIYASLPPAHDRPLRIESTFVNEGEEATLSLTNVDEFVITHIRVELNRAFHYLPDQPLAPGKRLTIPLRWFAKKSGHRFKPDKISVESVRVTARLPDHARAIYELALSRP